MDRMSDILRPVMIFPIGFVVIVILAFTFTRLMRWTLVNALALTMKSGVRYTGKRWDIVRGYVFDRDGHACRKCRASYRLLNCHHKVPVSRGGSHFTWNLITLCHRCHARRHPHMERE